MNRKQKGKIQYRIIFFVIVFLQFMYIAGCFQFEKEGFHSDELWSYGYANSCTEKDIYVDSNGLLDNVESWTSGKVLEDYLVVNEGEEFSYKSVYNNQINDLSPPLHSMLLHTVCSFFPGSFSKWYSFVINCFAFFITMCFLYKICRLFGNEKQAIMVCLVYGFCRGAVDNFIYLRMYALCTALLMVIIYNMLVIILRENNCVKKRNYVALFFTSLASFLTHYYMLAICGIVTALFCLYLLWNKQIKRMFAFGFDMLGAAVTSCIVFPSMLRVSKNQAVQIRTENVQEGAVKWDDRFRAVADFITEKSFGIDISQISSGKVWIVVGYLLYVMVVLAAFAVLFRKTAFVQRIFEKIKLKRNTLSDKKKDMEKLKKSKVWLCVILAVACVLQILLVAETSNVWGMGAHEDRYLFYIYPIVVMLGIFLLYKAASFLKNRKLKYILTGLVVFFSMAVQIQGELKDSPYFFRLNTEGVPIEEAVDGKYVVYVEENAWFLTAMTYKLMGCKEYILTNDSLCRFHAIEYLDKMKEGELYLVLNTVGYGSVAVGDGEWNGNEKRELLDERYNNLITFFEELVPETEMKLCSKEIIFGRPMEVYCINPEK